jgi:hypothetical protein
MNDILNQNWISVAEDRMAEYERQAAQQQLLVQAPSAPHAPNAVGFFHRISKLAAHIIRRQGKLSAMPGTPQAVDGEHIQTATS